ncbi:hypothetical protein C8R26_11170 [Nitrosomonas oligotropha]|uniref:Uncharacterized protein n=1 Tax=Nitrosomonas oligotropha TaxID=42354 RepID=A0A2T5HZM6_9PROT|nr:hypothetical protein C8R26_11170 [Nitrosomonas oligotropha]
MSIFHLQSRLHYVIEIKCLQILSDLIVYFELWLSLQFAKSSKLIRKSSDKLRTIFSICPR